MKIIERINKKVLCIFVAFTMVFSLVMMNTGVSVHADSAEYNATTKTITFDGSGDLVSATVNTAFTAHSDVENVVVTGYTSIHDAAFYDKSQLISVTIGNGVTSIGEHSFQNCNHLTSITIPDGITSIQDYTFFQCDHLTSITIPDSVTTICAGAFTNCTALSSITIPDSVTSIGAYAFGACSALTSVTIVGTVGTNGAGIDANGFYRVGTQGQDKTTLYLPEDAGITGPTDNNTEWKGGYFKTVYQEVTISACDISYEDGDVTLTHGGIPVADDKYYVNSYSSIEGNTNKITIKAINKNDPTDYKTKEYNLPYTGTSYSEVKDLIKGTFSYNDSYGNTNTFVFDDNSITDNNFEDSYCCAFDIDEISKNGSTVSMTGYWIHGEVTVDTEHVRLAFNIVNGSINYMSMEHVDDNLVTKFLKDGSKILLDGNGGNVSAEEIDNYTAIGSGSKAVDGKHYNPSVACATILNYLNQSSFSLAYDAGDGEWYIYGLSHWDSEDVQSNFFNDFDYTLTYADGDTITYANNPATGEIVSPGESIAATATKDGYNFDGWYTAKEGGTKVTVPTESQTLYAHWTKEESTTPAATTPVATTATAAVTEWKVGEKKIVNNATLTKLSDTTVSLKNKTIHTSTIKLPSTVTVDNKTYKITSLKRDCVHGHYVKKLVIPSTVTNLEYACFAGDKHLTSIKINSSKLTLAKNLFRNVSKKQRRKIKVTISKNMSKKKFNAVRIELVKQGLKWSNIKRK